MSMTIFILALNVTVVLFSMLGGYLLRPVILKPKLGIFMITMIAYIVSTIVVLLCSLIDPNTGLVYSVKLQNSSLVLLFSCNAFMFFHIGRLLAFRI